MEIYGTECIQNYFIHYIIATDIFNQIYGNILSIDLCKEYGYFYSIKFIDQNYILRKKMETIFLLTIAIVIAALFVNIIRELNRYNCIIKSTK